MTNDVLDNNDTVIQDNIRRFRLKAKMTQAELAELVGYADKSMIAKIESGKTEPPYEKMKKFAEALHVPLIDLYTTEEEVRHMNEEVEIWDMIMRKEANCELLYDPVVVPYLYNELANTENLYAKDNIYRHVAVPDWIACDFAVNAHDGSMLYAGIANGSDVFIQDIEVNNGELAAVLIEGEDKVRIRRIYFDDEVLTLQAAHPDFPPLVFMGDDMDDVTILGKAVYVLNELR